MGTIPCLYDTNTRFLLNNSNHPVYGAKNTRYQMTEVGLAPRKGTTPAREKMIYWVWKKLLEPMNKC